jgi:ABC-type multidrug transport system permease subunit
MRALWNAAEKDLRRHLRDPLALLLWLSLPLVIGGLMTLVMGGYSGPAPSIHLLVADEDGGVLSGLLAPPYNPGLRGLGLRIEAVGREAGRARIATGAATALLVIPRGFRDDVLNERPTTLRLITNPAQRILPQIVEESLGILVDGTFYGQRLFGPELRELAAGPPQGARVFSNDEIARISVAINQVMERLSKYLFPPAIQLETSLDQAQTQQSISPVRLFLPGVLFMALMFLAGSLSEDVWRERDQGTLRRVASTPTSVAALLGGKLLAGGIVILGAMLVVLLAGMLYLELPLRRLPLALAWTAASGVVLFLLLIAIQLHATSQRAGSVLTSSLVFPLLFLGGCMFPFEVMPQWMVTIGRRTPNGWALQSLKDILFGRADASDLGAALAVLLAVALALFLACERRMRRGFVGS